MIYEILEAFNDFYEKKKDHFLDNYALKDGLYVKIKDENDMKFFIVKNGELASLDGKNDVATDTAWLKKADYLSSWLEANKAVSDKKIHSSNYLSLFFKVENADEITKLLDKYYDVFYKFAKFSKKEDKEILQTFNDYLKDDKRAQDIALKHEIMSVNLKQIKDVAQADISKGYVKIFFDENETFYENEAKIYLSLKIFNSNEYNRRFKDEIYGLSNSNMGLNSKKPYLEHKNKRISAPFLIPTSDALRLKAMFDWLKSMPYKDDEGKLVDRYFNDFKSIFLQKFSSNDECVISEFDYIPVKEDEFNKNFEPINVINELLLIDDERKLIGDYKITTLGGLEQKIDELFYNKQLVSNYYRDSTDIKVSSYLSKDLQTILFVTKFEMINYFRKFNDANFYNILDKFAVPLIIANLREGRWFKAKTALNLKLALDKKYKENLMDITLLRNDLIKRLENSDYKGLNESEFLFLCGQVAAYLISQSKAEKKNADMLEPFLRCTDTTKLKATIEYTFDKYKYALSLNHAKFKNAVSLVLSYENDDKFKSRQTFLVGALSQNIFYQKSGKGEINE